MPSTRNIKTVENLKEKLSKAKSVVFADYKGLNANDINTLRTKIKEVDGDTAIAKNTLAKIALSEEKLGAPETALQGQTALILGYKDPIASIKALFEFIKEFKLPEVKGGIIDGIFASSDKIEILSALPSKEQLLTQVVRGLKSPINGIVNVLKGSQRNLVYALSALADKRKDH